MPEGSLLAYVLNQVDDGWTWRVYDVEGFLIAAGRALTQALAQSEVADLMQAHAGAPSPAGAGLRSRFDGSEALGA